ncbi:MAG: DinB family protein [Acidobacteria bacterium]|nr:DinB family protein [Acidobacteriota bacterium]
MTLTATAYLAETFDSLRAAAANLSPAQMQFKPSSEAWSIQEILQHLVMAEEMILGPIQDQISQAPPSPEPAPTVEVDAFTLAVFPDRSHKASAPQFLMPSGAVPSQQLFEKLAANSSRMQALLTNEAWLRARCIESEPIKAASQGKYTTLDGVQWLLLAAAHNARHTKQILEIQNDAHYPR